MQETGSERKADDKVNAKQTGGLILSGSVCSNTRLLYIEFALLTCHKKRASLI